MPKGAGSQCHTEGWRQRCFLRIKKGEGSVRHVEGRLLVTHRGAGTGEKNREAGEGTWDAL